MSENSIVEEQQAPKPNDKPAVWQLVIADMQARDDVGRKRYGTPLQPWNGRKPLVDAYQELLDMAVYLRQELFEREELERQLAQAIKALLCYEQILTMNGGGSGFDALVTKMYTEFDEERAKALKQVKLPEPAGK